MKSWRLISALLAVAAVALAGCSGKGVPINPPTPLEAFQPELKVEQRWSRQLGQGSENLHLKLRPLLDDERIFAASHGGIVLAVDARSGRQLWRVELNAELNAGPADAGEWLLFGTVSEVISLNKRDGSVVWRSEIGSEALSMPAWHPEVVVVHAGDGHIFGLNSQDGEILWRHHESVPSLSLRGTGDPVIIGDEGVLVGTASGKVLALSLRDGQILWESTIATARGRTELERMTDVDAELGIAEGVVYAASYQGVLAAVAMAGGQMVWNRDIASSSGISVDGEQIYVSDLDGNVWALSRRNGATMWRQQGLQYRQLSAPIQQGNYLIVGDYNGFLHWLSKDDGRLVARARIGGISGLGVGSDPRPSARRAPRNDRAVVMAPRVQSTWVYAMDKRGSLEAYEVTLLEGKGTR